MLSWLFPYERAVLWLYFGVLAVLLLRNIYGVVTRAAAAAASFTVTGLRNRKGLDEKVVATFPIFAYRTSVHGGRCGLGLDECSICWNDYVDGNLVRLLPCCHRFHAECVDAWFHKSTSCPYCRRDLAASSCQP